MRARTLILLFGLVLLGSVVTAAEPLALGEIDPLTGALARQAESVYQRFYERSIAAVAPFTC